MSPLARPATLVLLALAAGWGVAWFAAREPDVAAPPARPAVPGDPGQLVGGPTLEASPRAQVSRGEPPTAAPTVAPAAEPSGPWCSLRIDVVDALSGRDLPATWNRGSGAVLPPLSPPHQAIDDAVFERSRQRAVEDHQRWEAELRASGSVRPDVVRAQEGEVALTVSVRPPAGFVLLDTQGRRTGDRVSLGGALAFGVREITAVVPLSREAILDVRVLGPDGELARRVGFQHLVAAGTCRPFPLEERGPGVLRVRGIPFLPGEPVEGRIDWADSAESTGPPPEPLESEAPPANLRTTVPETLVEPWTAEVHLTSTARTSYEVMETDFDVRETAGRTSEGPCGRLRLKALGWDGQPLRGATLLGRVADEQGAVVVESLCAGPHSLSLDIPGRLPIRFDATLCAGEETRLEVREPVGARLEIEVLDGAGRPRPTSLLRIEGARHFDVEGTTQRLDLFTDHLGRRSIARVEPGEATIHASWGSRKGSEKVTLQDGVTTRVRIVAR